MTNEELRKLWVENGQGMKALKSVYQQGRADAIEELLKYLKSDKYDYWDIIRIAEQLKEQKND